MLTDRNPFAKITLASDKKARMERYRSGHNEAVLKTVCPQGHVGSNPTLSVYDISHKNIWQSAIEDLIQNLLEKYPSG